MHDFQVYYNNFAVPDYYAVLKIKRTATPSEVKTAYRKIAIQYHPDHNSSNQGAMAMFRQVVEAYNILHNPVERATTMNWHGI